MSLKSRGDLSLELLSLSRDVLSRSLERSLSREDLSFEDLKSAADVRSQVSCESAAIKQRLEWFIYLFSQHNFKIR